MKAIFYTLLIILILGGICVATCPDKDAHSEALKDLLNQVITEELSAGEEDAGLAMLGSMIGTGLGGLVIDNMLKVENLFVCSVGTITYEGQTHVVSIGLMNHVFTLEKDKARQMTGF